ncbi:MAG: alpha/beta fold hydrolase [Opitutae bacterium]|nr:alpha/beta fold hydrolase [Opitutae bacterium]
MKKVLLFSLFLLLVAAAAGGIYLRRFEFATLYHPSAEIFATPAHFQLRYQEVQFVASDGTPLHGWWIPANRPRGTVVYCHGNAGNIGSNAHLAPEFFKRGFHLLLWDYRGYGRSGGRPSENGFYDDARAAFDAAAAMSGPLPILVYGNSLGAAVAIQLAADRPAAALVVEGAFASAADIARRWYPNFPLARLLSVSYDSAAKAAALNAMPKLFGHSTTDEVIPFQSGRILHAAAAPPKTFVLLSGGHNDSSWFKPGAAGNAELEAFLGQFER